MTRPAKKPPEDWRTSGCTLTRAEVAAIVKCSTNNVETVVPALEGSKGIKRSEGGEGGEGRRGRRTRWSPDAVVAYLEGKPIPMGMARVAFMRVHDSLLEPQAVARILRCPLVVLPWLDIEPIVRDRKTLYERDAVTRWLDG